MRFLALIFSFLMIQACGNEKTPTQENVATQTPASESSGGSFQSPLSPGQSPLIQDLTTNYWVFEFYVDPKNQMGQSINEGRWYKFETDGTFTSGQWEAQDANGSWSIQKVEGADRLYLDSNRDAEDGRWNIQSNAGGDAMSWVGIRREPNQGVMLKAINLLTMPTREQFGVK